LSGLVLTETGDKENSTDKNFTVEMAKKQVD